MVIAMIVVSVLFFAAIVVIAAVLVYRNKREREYYNTAAQTSPQYLALLELNEKYEKKFYNLKAETPLYKRLHSKREFDRFQSREYFEEYIAKHLDLIESFIHGAECNAELWEKYQKDMEGLPGPADSNFAAKQGVPYETYLKYENQLVRSKTLNPVLNPKYVVVWSYTSPQGRNSYRDYRPYPLSQIKQCYEETKKRVEYQKTFEYQKKEERKKMSDTLRYEVLRRDHFRCVLCGRTAEDGVTLEVDHIIPVSKGGKTEMSNLRTLCKDCNRGKGAKIE